MMGVVTASRVMEPTVPNTHGSMDFGLELLELQAWDNAEIVLLKKPMSSAKLYLLAAVKVRFVLNIGFLSNG